jgi:hypothetical protein
MLSEPLGQRGERHQQQDGETDPDLGGCVLQPEQDLPEPHRPGRAGHGQARRDDQPGERAQHHDPGASAATGGGEEQRQQDDRGEVGDAGCGQRGLPHRTAHLAGVLEHGHDQPQ